MSTQSKKATVNDEHRVESARLLALWNRAKDAGKITSQRDVGEKYGIGTQAAVSHFLRGRAALSIEAAMGFSAALQVPIADFSTRLASEADRAAKFATPDEDDFIAIQQMDGYVYGGSGLPPNHDEVIGELKFRADFLNECGVTKENGRIIKVSGNSMHPRIPHGSVVLVKVNGGEPVAGKFFAIAHPIHGPIIKRLRFEGGLWYADSENPDYKPIPVVEENARIIGRAVWVGSKL